MTNDAHDDWTGALPTIRSLQTTLFTVRQDRDRRRRSSQRYERMAIELTEQVRVLERQVAYWKGRAKMKAKRGGAR